jgi:hypothetical protein
LEEGSEVVLTVQMTSHFCVYKEPISPPLMIVLNAINTSHTLMSTLKVNRLKGLDKKKKGSPQSVTAANVEEWTSLRKVTNVYHDPTHCAEPEVVLPLRQNCSEGPAQAKKLSVFELLVSIEMALDNSKIAVLHLTELDIQDY